MRRAYPFERLIYIFRFWIKVGSIEVRGWVSFMVSISFEAPFWRDQNHRFLSNILNPPRYWQVWCPYASSQLCERNSTHRERYTRYILSTFRLITEYQCFKALFLSRKMFWSPSLGKGGKQDHLIRELLGHVFW